jgi:hypothetical protein
MTYVTGRIMTPLRYLHPNPQEPMNVTLYGRGALKTADEIKITGQLAKRDYPDFPGGSLIT